MKRIGERPGWKFPLPLREGGFSLLEVLVAFSILSITLGVVLQVFGTGLRSTALAEEYTQAALRAESVLAAIGVEKPLKAGTEQGEINDRYSWRATISEYHDERADAKQDEAKFTPYQVVVEVVWQGGGKERSVVLETLRLASKEDAR
ncbi:MAG: type II secretion system protein [Gammaproteobacteria bacterium]